MGQPNESLFVTRRMVAFGVGSSLVSDKPR